MNPWAHRQNVVRLSLLFRYYYFGRSIFEPAKLVSLSHSCENSTLYSNRLHDFPVAIPRCTDVYFNSFYLGTARLLNSFPGDCFPFNHYVNDFTSRVKKHLLSLGAF